MSKPITRKEEYLAAAAGDKVDYPANPITREEAYLQRIAEGGSVEANPEEEPTGTLEKLKVGDGVYAVSSGGGGGTSDYSALNNKPQINGVTLTGNKTTGDLNISYDDLQNKPTIPSAQVQSDWNQTDNSKVDFIKNKPSIPDDLADLNDDASHRTVTDTEKATWNSKSDFSGDYNDLDNKPIIPNAQVQADWNQADTDAVDYIKNKPNIPAAQIQSDWDQSDDTKADYIKNKPALGTAAAKSVPTTGDAGSGEVVMGNDSRLSNSRPASDVSSWAKQATKPTYTASEVGAIPSTDKGANGGVATLGNDGIVPSSQLPAMFDGDYNSLTNKPTLGTAAAKDVPSAGNASLTEVVMGSDSRLSDDRNAKDVYSWAKAATKPTYTATEVGAIPSTDKGANGGVAELDSNGKVPSSQLPSYVDDVLSYASQSAFPATGETGKIYIAEDTNKTYRWSGSAYAEISASLALGETSSTAYRGDRGKTAYDHSQTTGNPHGTTASDVGLGNVPNVSTNDQTPTFTQASTRNNIASGEKLSVIFGKIQKFFNDLKTVAFSGSYTDLTNTPSLASVATSGSYADLTNTPTIPTSASGITYNNTASGLSATDVQGAVDELAEEKADKSDIAPEFNTTTAYAKGDLCYHEGTLYQFNQAHTEGAWNSAEVDEKNLAEVITDGFGNIAVYTMIKEATADGTKTYKQLINELFSNISFSIRSDYIISVDSAYRMYLMTSSSATKTFSSISASTGSIVVRSITYKPSDTTATIYVGNVINNNGFTATDYSNVATTATNKLRLYVRSR